MREKPQIILHEQVETIMDTFNPAIRDHDGRTFAIEIANCQRDSDYVWHKDRIALISEKIEKGLLTDEQLSEVEYFAVESPDKDAPESFKKRERRRAIAQAQLDKILALLKT